MTIPVGYCQINHKFTGAVVPTGAQVTMACSLEGFAGTAADAAEIADDAWRTNWMPNLNDELVLASTLVKFGPDATGASAEFASAAAGGSTALPATPQVAVLVTKNTASGGRAGRGRMYVPGVGEEWVSGAGLLTSTIRGELQSAMDGYLGDLLLTLGAPVLLHQPGAPLTTPSPITSATVQNKVATQRQRLRR